MTKIINDLKLDFNNVLIKPRYSDLNSRQDVVLEREFCFKYSKQRLTAVPILAANMDTIGRFQVAKVLAKFNMLTVLHKFYSVSDIVGKSREAYFKNCIVSSGIRDQDLDRLYKLIKKLSLKIICLDVANGYTQRFLDTVKKVRKDFPKVTIIAGNVATVEGCRNLIRSGADVVKVGIGPGSVCTTRKKTGVGYPQLSAILECSQQVHKLGAYVISDGGCVVSGDVAKAFCAGADFVMLGGMFAGHYESGGDLVVESGKKYKVFYGMSSDYAMEKYYGGVADYKSSEGKVVKVEYRGRLEKTVKDLLGGVRSACTYIGAKTIDRMPQQAVFIKVSNQLNTVFGD